MGHPPTLALCPVEGNQEAECGPPVTLRILLDYTSSWLVADLWATRPVDIDEWASYVRRALLGFLTLYFRADKQALRDPTLDRIAESNFDNSRGDALRKEADIDALFAELTTT